MKKTLLISLLAALTATAAPAQKVWTLQECLDYALENNIQLRQTRNTLLSGLEDTEQARAALFPTLSASSSQGVSANPFISDGVSGAYNGSYGVNADMTLYSGGKLRNAIRAQEVQNERDSLSVLENEMDIRISIVQAYLQCLYAAEAVTVNESTVEVARAQRDRAQELKNAGTLSKVDVAQLESQLYSDEYQLTVSRTNLDSYRLQLKQLLELDINEEMILSDIEASEEEVLRLLPEKTEVYERARNRRQPARRHGGGDLRETGQGGISSDGGPQRRHRHVQPDGNRKQFHPADPGQFQHQRRPYTQHPHPHRPKEQDGREQGQNRP